MKRSQSGSKKQQQMIAQIIQAYAQLTQEDPRKIMQQLQQMPADQQQKSLESMYKALQLTQQQSQQQAAAPQQQMAASPDQSQMMDQSQGEQMYRGGGSTYSAGVWYGNGGTSYIPEYNYAYGGYHSEIPSLFNQPVDRPNKAMYGMGMAYGGGYYANGGKTKTCYDEYGIAIPCPPGYLEGSVVMKMGVDNTFTKYPGDAKKNMEIAKRTSEIKHLKKDLYEGLKPSYNFSPYYSGATPGFLDSVDYKYNFNEAPKLFTSPSRVENTPANYGFEEYKNHEDDTDLEWELNEGLPYAYTNFLKEGKYNLVKTVDNEQRAYADWLKQAKQKYYDSKGNLKKEYKQYSKELKLPLKFPNEIETGYKYGGMPKAMYGMAQGGKPCYNCGGMYEDGGSSINDGRLMYDNQFEEGGIVVGKVMDASPELLQKLEEGGYTYKIIH